MRELFKIGAVFLISSIFLTGCLPNIGSSGGPADADEFVKGQIVRGFPPLPAYENAKVIESYGKDNNFGATIVTNDDLAKVVNFYQDGLELLGWEVSVSGAGTNFVFDIKNEKNIGSIIINTAADNRRTVITIAVSSR